MNYTRISAIFYRPLLLAVFCGLTITVLTGCSRTTERRRPLGEAFPQVEGTRLSGERIVIPDDFEGEPIILLVGYIRDSQFDIDRWLLGLAQAETPIRAIEAPTIKGWIPHAISGWIDSGMRRGIPEEDWRSVATIYTDAETVIDFLGNEEALNARVVLINGEGRVEWMHDQGYSASKLMELDERVRQLKKP